MNHDSFQPPNFSTRRQMLKTLSSGFGYLAFASLATRASGAVATAPAHPEGPLAPKRPHFPARAKRVIFLCMRGGPSHVDTFDYKPKLTADVDKEIGKGRVPTAKLMAPPWKFSQR